MFNFDELKRILEDGYSFQVLEIKPIKRDIYQLKTDCGYWRLIRVRLKPSKLNFAQSVTEALKQRDYHQLAQIYLTKNRQSYIEADYSFWVLSDWFNGREVNLHNLYEIELVTRGLAKLHSTLKEVGVGKKAKKTKGWNKWPETVLTSQKFFEAYLEKLARADTLTDFEQMVWDNSSSICHNIRFASRFASSKPCQQLIEEEAGQMSLIYRLMREDQIILGFDERVYFINPLKIQYDVRVKDLAIWIKRLAKKAITPKQTILQVIEWYAKERALSLGEEAWLSSYLYYPEKVFKVIDRYSGQKKAWPEEGYLRKLRKCLAKQKKEINIYQEMIQKFNRLEDF